MAKQINLFDMSEDRLPWQFTRKLRRTVTLLDVTVRTDTDSVRKIKLKERKINK